MLLNHTSMNREMNPFEFEQRIKLGDLKKEYADIKKTVKVLLENKNKPDADKMEQRIWGNTKNQILKT